MEIKGIKSCYFPKGCREFAGEIIYVPDRFIIHCEGDCINVNYKEKDLKFFLNFLKEKKSVLRRAKKQRLMKTIEVSSDLSDELRYCCLNNRPQFVPLYAWQILQSARTYRES